MTRRSYDCQIFYNELDILEIRLGVLGDLVDRFVIVESPITIAGHAKPLYFQEHRNRFAKWAHKIVHHVTELPWQSTPHERERIMRNSLIDAVRLDGGQTADLVMITDADEIVSPAAIEEYSPSMGLAAPEQLMSQYWINCISGGWGAVRIAPLATFLRYTPDQLRRGPDSPAVDHLLGRGRLGGWHWTFMDGPEAVLRKVQAYSHQELNLPQFTDPNWIAAAVHTPFDIFARSNHEYQFCSLDERFPSYLREQRDRFSHLWKDAFFHERWTSDSQLMRLFAVAHRQSRGVPGIVIEIGSWEGRSTVVLAHARPGELIYAVDNWQTSIGAGSSNNSEQPAAPRDLFAQFQRNIASLTKGNVRPIRKTSAEFFRDNQMPIAFLYIDGLHDYETVYLEIESALKRLSPGGTICGDDFEAAAATRVDLNGGVERAVRELLPGFTQHGNFWTWTR